MLHIIFIEYGHGIPKVWLPSQLAGHVGGRAGGVLFLGGRFS